MSEGKVMHTPGPWLIEYDNADESCGGQWYCVGPARVLFPYNAGKEREETAKADAALIASAPTLAAELAKLREDYRLLREQFEYFVAAKRFDRKEFEDDTAVLDWMLSRSRHMLETTAKGRAG